MEEIDYKAEIEPYMDQFYNANIRATSKGEELISSSPFREDNSPSFSLNLETGLWIDFGSDSEIWNKGNFFKLLSFLTGEHYADIERAFIERYKGILNEVDSYELSVTLEQQDEYKVFNLSDFPYFKQRSSYLTNRGITEKAQAFFSVGYDTNNKAIAIPYRDKQGRVVNVKFRKVTRKQFYYLPNGQPVGQHVFGLDKVLKHKFKTAYVTESEIDAMYLWSYGIPAVALGTANLSRRQEQLLQSSPIEELVLAFDNDRAGRKATKYVTDRLLPYKRLSVMELPEKAKDVNDLPIETIKNKDYRVRSLTPVFTVL